MIKVFTCFMQSNLGVENLEAENSHEPSPFTKRKKKSSSGDPTINYCFSGQLDNWCTISIPGEREWERERWGGEREYKGEKREYH